MNYLRIYSERTGDSHFAQAQLAISEPDHRPPAPPLFVSHTYGASGLQFVRLPGGWTSLDLRRTSAASAHRCLIYERGMIRGKDCR